MKPNTRVRVTTNNGLVFTGTVIKGKDYTLKLDDGYNVGIEKRNVKDIQEIATEKKSSAKPRKVTQDKTLPRIALLHTGGTIASKVDYETGGVSNKITPKELLAMYPELQTVAQVQATLVTQISSEDVRFAHYNNLINAVQQAVKNKAKGVIITHGTDTLHYSSAALHYALQGVPIPVVLVGSQRSADRGSSDAHTNLMGAARFITELSYPGVFVAMHGSSNDDDIIVLRGTNIRKNHTSRRDAFTPINTPVVARITGDGVHVVVEPPTPQKKFTPTTYNKDLKVGMVYVHPQFFADALTPYTDYDGLVVLGTGLGHAPINTTDSAHKDVRKKLFALTKNIPVVMTSQCIHGRINLQVYSSGRALQDAGVLGHDLALSPETAFIKLSWLLSQERDVQKEFDTDYGDAVLRIEEGA